MSPGIVAVDVDEDRCCGAGRCVQAAPNVFAQRESDATGYVILAHLEQEHEEPVLEAAALCPVGAVRVVGR